MLCVKSVRSLSTQSMAGINLRRISFKGSAKFLNFYGQPEARLNRDDSVYGHSTNRRTWFIKSISIFLFSAPDVHLENLQKMWVDRILHNAVWEEGLRKVTDEWQEFILYVSVTKCKYNYMSRV